jgi:hypothetical protein|nr:hypothetical protein [Candidatus Acidoferrales bacterium]
MSAGIVTNEARNAAEVGVPNKTGSPVGTPAANRFPPANSARQQPQTRGTVTSGRNHPPISGSVRGTGVPRVQNASAETAMLCNITEQTWILHRTHGTFVVAGRNADARSQRTGSENSASEEFLAPASDITNSSAENSAPLDAPYALTQISARTGAIDLGDKRTLEFPISARDIAEDLAREINADGGEASYFGVFVCDEDVPREDELAEAHERLELFYVSLVNSADKQWERTHNVAFISDLERRAARELRLEKDWSYEPTMRNECPACGERLKPNVAVCRVCGAVLNREKAAQWGLLASPAAEVIVAPPAHVVAADASRQAETARK